jgi:hypothetical protein
VGTRRDRIDRDRPPAQLLREDRGQRLDRALGGGVDAVGLEPEADDAGREVDDASAWAQAPRRFAQSVERALQVHGDQPIEGHVVDVGELGQGHDPRIVHQHVHATERSLRGVEQRADGLGVADVGPRSERATARRLDLSGQDFGGSGVARIVDDDGKAIAGQTFRHRCADAAGRAGDDRDLPGVVRHAELLSLPSRRRAVARPGSGRV